MYDLDGSVPPLISGIRLVINNNSIWPYILLIGILLLGAFFSGAETAYSSVNRYRLDVDKDNGSKSAKLALNILDNFDNLIIIVLIGTNLTHILMSVIATVLATSLLGAYGSIVSTAIITLIVFFFGEMIPKSVAKYNANWYCKVSSYFLKFLTIILWPIAKVFELLVMLVRKIFKQDDENDEEAFTEDDFQDVIEQIEEEGAISEDESDIIQNAVDFGDIKVKEILTKKDNIIALDISNCNPKFLNEFLLETEYSRIPIYDGSIDNIIGILHVRTYLREYFKNNNLNVRNVLKKPYTVSSQETLDDIFEGFKRNKTHIAIIKSTRGKTLGMVTMKDVLEELVGEIDEGQEALHDEESDK